MLEIMTLSAVTPAPAAPSPDWWGALNGLHPIVIHFPIALVITAAIVEFIAMLARKERPTQFTVISLVVAALAGAVASWSGWGLADEGYGGGWSLTLHRWLGVGTSGLIILLAILALVAWYGAKAWATASVRAGILVAAGLVAATAHFGGDMVWGGSLVIDALFPEQPATGAPTAPAATEPAKSDAAPAAEEVAGDVPGFKTAVVPILDRHCWKCHGPADRGKRAKAGIRLSNEAELLDTLDGTPMISPGDPEGSLLFHVVTLPREDEDAMPPSGPGLDPEEIETLKAWIEAGAPFGGGDATAPEPAVPAAGKPGDDRARNDDPTVLDTVAPVLARLKDRGVPARPIARDSSDLEFSANGLSHRIDPPFGDEDLRLLDGLQPVLVEIDLGNTAVTDTGVASLAGFDALRVVKLKETRTGDGAATALAALPAVEVVNFFGTDLGDAGLLALARGPAMRTVYAGESDVTEAGVAAALETRPGLVVHHQAPVTALPAEPEPAASGSLDAQVFKTSIQPILDTDCGACHGAEGRAKGGLRLGSLDQLLEPRGGAPLVVPGDPDASLLLKRITLPRDAEGAMPPKGPGLTEAQIRTIRDWITAAGD